MVQIHFGHGRPRSSVRRKAQASITALMLSLTMKNKPSSVPRRRYPWEYTVPHFWMPWSSMSTLIVLISINAAPTLLSPHQGKASSFTSKTARRLKQTSSSVRTVSRVPYAATSRTRPAPALILTSNSATRFATAPWFLAPRPLRPAARLIFPTGRSVLLERTSTLSCSPCEVEPWYEFSFTRSFSYVPSNFALGQRRRLLFRELHP